MCPDGLAGNHAPLHSHLNACTLCLVRLRWCRLGHRWFSAHFRFLGSLFPDSVGPFCSETSYLFAAVLALRSSPRRVSTSPSCPQTTTAPSRYTSKEKKKKEHIDSLATEVLHTFYLLVADLASHSQLNATVPLIHTRASDHVCVCVQCLRACVVSLRKRCQVEVWHGDKSKVPPSAPLTGGCLGCKIDNLHVAFPAGKTFSGKTRMAIDERDRPIRSIIPKTHVESLDGINDGVIGAMVRDAYTFVKHPKSIKISQGSYATNTPHISLKVAY